MSCCGTEGSTPTTSRLDVALSSRLVLSRPAFTVLLVALLASVLVAVGAVRGDAADPDAIDLGPSAVTATWDGAAQSPVYPTGDNGATNACPPRSADPANTICDHITVNVGVDEAYWEDHNGGVRMTISFPEGDDWEVQVFRNDDDPLPLINVATGNNPETLFIDQAFGSYEVRVSPYLTPSGEGYVGLANFIVEDPLAVADTLSPGFQAFNGTRVPSVGTPEEDFTNPVARYDGRPVKFRQSDIGREAAEPTIGAQQDGDLYFAAGTFDSVGGAAARTEIKRSTDNGLSWQDVSPQLGGDNAQQASLDPYVYVSEYTDRVFSIDLLVANFSLYYTDDDGENWAPAAIDASNAVQDHQTVFSAPAPEGFPLPVTADEIIYYCFNKIAEATCSRSLDGGDTFTRTGFPAFPGADVESGGFCGGLHGHVGTDDEGRVFLPKGHCNRPWLAISDDAGTTWTTVKVADMEFPEQQASVDADSEGNLYYVWYDTNGLPYLATSTDHGVTWSEPLMIAPPGVGETQWPTVYAGDAGRVAIGFPCTRAVGDAAQLPNRNWDHCMVMSTNALDDNPTFISNISNPINDPVHRGECPGRCGRMYDFLDVAVQGVEGGGRTVAAFVDTCTDELFAPEEDAALACNINPAALGFDGDNHNQSGDMDGLASIQVCGPSLWAAVGEITDDCQLDTPLDPGGVIVLGGTAAVAESVDAALDVRDVRRGRIQGADRYETAANIARSVFATGSGTVYIATGELFPDGLAGAPAAADVHAPVLLTAKDSLPASTRQLLEDFAPKNVIVIGGPNAVSDAVVGQIADVTGVEVERLAGETRYDTAVMLSEATYPDGADTVVVATGEDFPDALSGAAAAARLKAPVLLTMQGTLPTSTRDELTRLGADRVIILGGETAVGNAVALQIVAATQQTPERLSGATRYDTAVAISQNVWPDGASPVFLATGRSFPDALAGAAAAARKDSPVLLTPTAELAEVAGDEIERLLSPAVPATVR